MELLVPIATLSVSRNNVRRTKPLLEIPLLAALIKSQGLLQKLLVRAEGNDQYRVVDGRRRHAAIKSLIKSGDWPGDKPVAVELLTDEQNDVEVSLAANLGGLDMHPADTFEAFRHLIEDEGATPDALSARFGYALSTVQGFLKLANVSPRLMKAFRNDEVTLEQMKALAITDDHKRQEAVFYESPEYLREPRDLRRLLMQGRLKANDRLARFVTIEAYEAAGGAVARDLFSDGEEVYLEDSGLLNRLATDKLEQEAEALRSKGWKWLEIHPEMTNGDLMQLPRISSAVHGMTPDSKAARHYGGVVLGIDRDGNLVAITGVLKPESAKALARARHEEAEVSGSDVGGQETEGAPRTAKLVEELTAIRTTGLRQAVSSRPAIALAVVVHDLALGVFYDLAYSHEQLSQVRPELSDVVGLIGFAAGKAAAVETERTIEYWKTNLPPTRDALWSWLTAQKSRKLLDLLAVLVALNIDATQRRQDHVPSERVRAGDRLAATLALDMAKWWRPDAERLSRFPRAGILSALREARSPDVAARCDHGTKHDLLATAERELQGTGWLPQELRTFAGGTDQESLAREAESSAA